MDRNKALANRLREVFLNGQWIANTNYKAQLNTSTWQQATQTVKNLNTIAALTFHVNYYLIGLIQVLDGGELEIKDKYSFDMAPIEKAEDWTKLVETLLSNAEKFADRVEKLPEEKLDQPFVHEKYGSYFRNIEAVVEHAYYHLGQISLIKKMV